MNLQNLTQEEIEVAQAAFISKVYTWMTGALVVTGLIAQWVIGSEYMLNLIFGSRFGFIGLIIAEFACVIYLSARINKMSAATAVAVFIGYAALNGLTLSAVFLMYTASSIATTFYVTAGTFAVMSAYGYYTKKDLTSIGNLAFMGLIGIIIASVVNMFLQSPMMYWIITYVGILVFVGLIAYDTQKIKNMNVIGASGSDEEKKVAILGALTLYLDFINLFLMLLRLLGNRK